MKLYDKINSDNVYIIAEMSANHAGKLSNALEIVHAAKESGADCLKIQTYTADTLTINCDNEYFRIKGGLWDGRNLYELYQEAYTPWEWQPTIKQECEKVGLDFLSTPFDNTAVDFLESIGAEAYKIASFELVDIPLIEYTASKQKLMIISTGMGSIDEIQDAIDACLSMGNNKIVILKCCSEYPAQYANMRLANISDMKEQFGLPIGLSDHSSGSLAAIVSVALGACVIEKHFCLSRTIKNPDSEFSMEPDEFRQMVKQIRDAIKIRGKVDYTLTGAEQKSSVFRRSLFAVQNIRKGDTISAANVKSVRPSNGLQPKYLNVILGKPALSDIPFGTPITKKYVMIEDCK